MNIQEVHGSDYEIGRQRGHRNAEHIRSMIRRYVRSEMTPEYLVLRTKLLSSVEKRFPDGFAEMQGIADGSDIPLERICDLNLYPSVSWLVGCTSFAFRTSDRGPLMGKTGDCGLEQRENYLLLFRNYPDGRRVFHYTLFGFVCAADGMNSDGLVIGSSSAHPTCSGSPDGVPAAFLTVDILGRCRDTGDVQERCRTYTMTGKGMASVVLDRAGDAAYVDFAPDRVVTTRAEREVAFCSNFYTSAGIEGEKTEEYWCSTRSPV